MDKVSILTSSALQPSVSIPPRSELIALFGPTFTLALRLQKVVAAVSFFVFATGWFLACLALSSTVIVGKTAATHSFFASRVVLSQSGRACCSLWNTKTIKRLRNKIIFEFVWIVLGPGGNTLLVMIFWPGWWLLIAALLLTRLYAG